MNSAALTLAIVLQVFAVFFAALFGFATRDHQSDHANTAFWLGVVMAIGALVAACDVWA